MTIKRHTLTLGRSTKTGMWVEMDLAMANRHGLVAGSTGTGKTVTLQALAEGFSTAGVPVFATDIKGDLSGVASMGGGQPWVDRAYDDMGTHFTPHQFLVDFWAIGGNRGAPITIQMHMLGAALLSRVLNLSPTQASVMDVVFAYAKDQSKKFDTVRDLERILAEMSNNARAVSDKYGYVSPSTLAIVQRSLQSLKTSGGEALFSGKPPFDPMILLDEGFAMSAKISLLDATNLIDKPQVYSVFLLWLLREVYARLPEVGDLEKPKLIMFFDEAHLLFADGSKELLAMIERTVRLIRSKGVGVYFVTQSPSDVPDTVLAQLGNRFQHGLQAFTPKGQRALNVVADTFRENPDFDIREELSLLTKGEALVSTLGADGMPQMADTVTILPPSAHVGPVDESTRAIIVEGMTYNPFEDFPEDAPKKPEKKPRKKMNIGALQSHMIVGFYGLFLGFALAVAMGLVL